MSKQLTREEEQGFRAGVFSQNEKDKELRKGIIEDCNKILYELPIDQYYESRHLLKLIIIKLNY